MHVPKQNFDHLMAQVLNNVEPTIICSDNGEKVLLMPLDEFNSLQETLYLLSNPANAEHLRQSIAQAKIGKTKERKSSHNILTSLAL